MLRAFVSIGVLAFTLSASPAALAQGANPTTSEMIDSLKPRKFRGQRGVTVVPGQAPDGLASLNLTVNFQFNSSQLTTDTQLVLSNLGKALQSEQLKTYRFRIDGHTDAVGGDDFNKRLSEARAKAVVDHLVSVYGIAPSRISFVGLGRSRLYNAADPNSAVNRRVEIVNVGS
jgi:outer membrane protein OmpA-like peptidoglycan-associated protein